jgi:hypothetical protein
LKKSFFVLNCQAQPAHLQNMIILSASSNFEKVLKYDVFHITTITTKQIGFIEYILGIRPMKIDKQLRVSTMDLFIKIL